MRLHNFSQLVRPHYRTVIEPDCRRSERPWQESAVQPPTRRFHIIQVMVTALFKIQTPRPPTSRTPRPAQT